MGGWVFMVIMIYMLVIFLGGYMRWMKAFFLWL